MGRLFALPDVLPRCQLKSHPPVTASRRAEVAGGLSSTWKFWSAKATHHNRLQASAAYLGLRLLALRVRAAQGHEQPQIASASTRRASLKTQERRAGGCIAGLARVR